MCRSVLGVLRGRRSRAVWVPGRAVFRGRYVVLVILRLLPLSEPMKLPSINNVSSGAMIVASAVLVWATMDRPAVLPIRPPDLYAVGDRFGEVPGYDFARSPTTLVLFVRSGCRF